MRAYRRFSTWWQMGAAVCAFLVMAAVLESGALYDWAERLEVGPERAAVLPVATRWHDAMERWGFEGARRRMLAGLVRVGWSDEPVEAVAPVETKPRLPLVVPLVHAEDRVETSVAAGVKTPAPAVLRPLLPMLGAPPLVSRLPPLEPLALGQTRTVALVGDSMMAVGLAPTLLRAAPQDKQLTLVKSFRSGTGLARPEVFDWQAQYPAMLKGARPDVVIVAMGANDGQGFVENGVVYDFGSERWKEIYQQRVQAFLEMLEADGATVVWVGLPPMKQGGYDARMALVNRIAYSVVSASPQAVWFSTGALLGDANGSYREFGRVRGSTARLRAEDGVHWSDDGASLVSGKLMAWLEKQ